ncbi:MAG: chalcone isomerase family protein [Pseudomonadales bacterium]
MQTRSRTFRLPALLLIAVLSAWSPWVTAAELSGVTFQDSIPAGAQNISLNGLGLRKVTFIKVYVGGLYLAAPTSDAQTVLDSEQAKAVRMHFLRDVSRDQLIEAFEEGFDANAPDKDGSGPEFERMLTLVPDVKEGEELTFLYLPGAGTTLTLGAAELGTFTGKPFSDAVFSLWMGPKPPNADLKKGMLGG